MNTVKKQIILNKIQKEKLDKSKSGEYSLFDASFVKLTDDNMEIVYDILSGWDKECKIPKDVGEFLNQISNDPENAVAIHRTHMYEESNVLIEKIAKEGLINNGHIMSSGAGGGIPSLSLTLSPLVGMTGFINLVGSYKNNNLTVIYSFPTNLVDKETLEFKNDDAIKQVYDFKNRVYIKPEYIVGAIVKGKNGELDKFLTHDEMLSLNMKNCM